MQINTIRIAAISVKQQLQNTAPFFGICNWVWLAVSMIVKGILLKMK